MREEREQECLNNIVCEFMFLIWSHDSFADKQLDVKLKFINHGK